MGNKNAHLKAIVSVSHLSSNKVEHWEKISVNSYFMLEIPGYAIRLCCNCFKSKFECPPK